MGYSKRRHRIRWKWTKLRVKKKRNRKKSRTSQTNSSSSPVAHGGAPSTQQNSPRNQYHHYIPRFVLRNFALDDHVKRPRGRQDIYHYSITSRQVRIAKVDTTYGISNMYSDVRNVSDINFVEKELGKLEQKASMVIKQLLDLSQTELTITATELDAMKKFLFIMSFRHPRRQQQYLDGRFDPATKARQEKYMKANNLSLLSRMPGWKI